MEFLVRGTRDDSAVERDREHIAGRHPLFLHAARRDDNVLAVADAAAAARCADPADTVESPGQIAHERTADVGHAWAKIITQHSERPDPPHSDEKDVRS